MLENNVYINLRDFTSIAIPTIVPFLLIGIGVLIRRNNTLKKNNFQLQSLNKMFEASLSNKELQLKEIHHRIKNNLQLIVSLLNIEAGNNKDTTVDDFLIKGQSRIHSISLIHQNLYETEFCTTINLKKLY